MSILRIHSPSGSNLREGKAISFFPEVPTEIADPRERKSAELNRFGFHASYPYFVESLPHLLLEDQTKAVLKITAFAQTDA